MAGCQQSKVANMVVMYVLLIGTMSVLIGACASTSWLVVSVNVGGRSFETEQGLWKTCAPGVCVDIPEEILNSFAQEGEFRGARAFMIMAVLLSIAWATVSLVGEFLRGRRDFSKATEILGSTTAAMAVITGMVYLGYAQPARNRVSAKYSVGFALLWFAVPLAIGAAVISRFHFKNKYEQFHAAGRRGILSQSTGVTVGYGQLQTEQPPMDIQPMLAQPYPARALPQAPPQVAMAQFIEVRPAVAQAPPPYGHGAEEAAQIA